MNRFGMLVLAVLLALLSSAAIAQEFPAKPIRIIVPWPAGGIIDLVARIVAKELSASLGQPVVTENRPGAGGMIGAEVAANAAPDGYSLMVTSSALGYYQNLYRSLPFDPVEGFVPIAPLANASHLLIVHESVRVKTTRDLIALAKANPGKLTYGFTGAASPSNLAGELFKSIAGVDILGVPYKGSPEVLADLLAGRISMYFSTIALTLPQVKSGRIRMIAIGSRERSQLLPDLPTVSESGAPGFESSLWIGAFAPAKTSNQIVEKLNAAIANALKTKTAADLYASNGLDSMTGSPREFGKFFKEDAIKWGKIIKAAGIQLN